MRIRQFSRNLDSVAKLSGSEAAAEETEGNYDFDYVASSAILKKKDSSKVRVEDFRSMKN